MSRVLVNVGVWSIALVVRNRPPLSAGVAGVVAKAAVPTTDAMIRFGLPGSITRSTTARFSPTPIDVTANLLNVGDGDIAFVERNNPRFGTIGGADGPMPPMPEVVPTKIMFGSVGWTTMSPMARPLNTSLLPASLLMGPTIAGDALLAFSMR